MDRSVNLTGMLTDIGKTVGSMGESYAPVMQAATKPRGDMNDPMHLQNLAQWASSNGDAAAASMYMSQARELKAEQKEAREKLEAETKTKAASAATLQYKTALESGNPDDIAKAEGALMANAAALGYDGLERMGAAQTFVTRQADAAWTEQERERTQQERLFNEQFMGKMNAAEDAEAIQKAVEQAPPEMQPAAQRAATARIQYLEARDARSARDAENLQTFDPAVTVPEELPETLKKQYAAEAAQLEKDAEASKVNGTWEPSVRKTLQQRRERLAATINDTLVRDVLNKESEERTVARQWQNEWNKAGTAVPSKEMAKQIRKDLEDADSKRGDWVPFNDKRITQEEVIAEYRRQLKEGLEPTRPSGVAGASEESGEQGYTEEQTALIDRAAAQYPDKSREEVIAALKDKGKL